MSKRKGSGILCAIGIYIVWCCVFFHNDDPYMLFDTIVDFVSGFSQLSSAMGNTFKSLLSNSSASTDITRNFFYDIFTGDFTRFSEAFENFMKNFVVSFKNIGFWWK